MVSAFEKMIQDFSKKDTTKILEDCMKMDAKKMKKIPLRYRLIALGFVSHMSLEQLENKLNENDCEQLYARNFTEASLIYAFYNGLSYSQCVQLETLSRKKLIEEKKDIWFNDSNVTYGELLEYIKTNSEICEEEMKTQKVTRLLEEQIKSQGSLDMFLDFMERNQQDFRIVREKTRYYFCKYLSYYIEEKIENYLLARKKRFGVEQAAAELNVLKCAAKLRQKFNNDDEIREMLRECGISFGNIYDAFNYYYFEYISSDWMEIQMEYYGSNLDDLSKKEKAKLAQAIRAYKNGWEQLSDEEVIQRKLQEMEEEERRLDEQHTLTKDESSNIKYHKSRAGEKSVRNYIRGTVDIDRTTLICYLLFFGQDSLRHREWVLTEKRLNEILGECGYAILRKENEFDWFVTQYLEADDKVEFLMDSVTSAAMEEKNFYLYHMYQGAISENDKLKELLH